MRGRRSPKTMDGHASSPGGVVAPAGTVRATSKSKYGNKKTVVDGITFDSAKEAKRWTELKLLERGNVIRNLERQVPFKVNIDGHHICTWIADFVYFEGQGRVIEDVKSPYTRKLPVYRLKKKLIEAMYGLRIQET